MAWVEPVLLSFAFTGTYAVEGEDTPESTPKSAKDLVAQRCRELHETYGNYGEVARRLDLDWRTVKKNVTRET